MKVGYLGPKGTFSNEMCDMVYSENDEKIQYRTISEIIKDVESNVLESAVVPIENSIQGPVTETIDYLMKTKNIQIEKEEVLNISQNLMAKENYDFSEIKEIYSHPQALAQCDKFIKKYLKDAKLISISSTALAAKEVAQKENAACICNKTCSKEYGLTILKEDIQDNNNNATKFWKISNNLKQPAEQNKMTVIFSLKHSPGSLYNALGVFEKYNVNLTKIESRPTKEKLGEYYFWVDFEIKDINYQKLIQELENKVLEYKILGIY